MNEQFKELAERSRLKVESFMSNPPKPFQILGSTEQFEKFAELIVRECANVALEQKKWVEDMKAYNSHHETWNQARIQQSQHIVDKIKQHFGVKE